MEEVILAVVFYGAILGGIIYYAIKAIINNKKWEKEKEKELATRPTPTNVSWHNLPASEVFGDSNALEETRKKWHSKPLTF